MSVYPDRPVWFEAYPFWFRHIRSPEAWSEAAGGCPGIGLGRLYSRGEVLAIAVEGAGHAEGVAS